jgi:hypothetical protein
MITHVYGQNLKISVGKSVLKMKSVKVSLLNRIRNVKPKITCRCSSFVAVRADVADAPICYELRTKDFA